MGILGIQLSNLRTASFNIQIQKLKATSNCFSHIMWLKTIKCFWYNFIVINFRKDNLLFYTKRVIATTIKRFEG